MADESRGSPCRRIKACPHQCRNFIRDSLVKMFLSSDYCELCGAKMVTYIDESLTVSSTIKPTNSSALPASQQAPEGARNHISRDGKSPSRDDKHARANYSSSRKRHRDAGSGGEGDDPSTKKAKRGRSHPLPRGVKRYCFSCKTSNHDPDTCTKSLDKKVWQQGKFFSQNWNQVAGEWTEATVKSIESTKPQNGYHIMNHIRLLTGRIEWARNFIEKRDRLLKQIWEDDHLMTMIHGRLRWTYHEMPFEASYTAANDAAMVLLRDIYSLIRELFNVHIGKQNFKGPRQGIGSWVQTALLDVYKSCGKGYELKRLALQNFLKKIEEAYAKYCETLDYAEAKALSRFLEYSEGEPSLAQLRLVRLPTSYLRFRMKFDTHFPRFGLPPLYTSKSYLKISCMMKDDKTAVPVVSKHHEIDVEHEDEEDSSDGDEVNSFLEAIGNATLRKATASVTKEVEHLSIQDKEDGIGVDASTLDPGAVALPTPSNAGGGDVAYQDSVDIQE